ncbi:MAG: Fic family protein [Akkermansia sp.]|nr:Fic family protein [Akkermansia sp.]
MERKETGRYVVISTVGERAHAFIPAPLPPCPLPQIDATTQQKLGEATRRLAALDAVGQQLPDITPFIYTCVRREAVLSSRIEGTQSSLSDLLLYEQGAYEQADTDDVALVSHYVSAMQLGMQRMEEGFPISLRLIRELHRELLRQGRGATKMPGEFRQSQNWIGGTRPGNAVYVPPPAQEVIPCLGDLELFINREDDMIPGLIKAALVHVQFESIHPFLDGNGRIGRLLIQMMFCRSGLLSKPLLYLSLYFKQHRQDYYRLLGSIRETGNWEAWIDFFLDAVAHTAAEAFRILTELRSRMEQDAAAISRMGRMRFNAAKVLDYMQHRIIARPSVMVRQLNLSAPTVYKILDAMVQEGIILPCHTGQRNRLYAYTPYREMLADH